MLKSLIANSSYNSLLSYMVSFQVFAQLLAHEAQMYCYGVTIQKITNNNKLGKHMEINESNLCSRNCFYDKLLCQPWVWGRRPRFKAQWKDLGRPLAPLCADITELI